jgi:hypothetical protein
MGDVVRSRRGAQLSCAEMDGAQPRGGI